MLYNWREGDLPYADLFVDGVHVVAHCLWLDTETGEYEALKLDESGQAMLSDDRTTFLTYKSKFTGKIEVRFLE